VTLLRSSGQQSPGPVGKKGSLLFSTSLWSRLQWQSAFSGS